MRLMVFVRLVLVSRLLRGLVIEEIECFGSSCSVMVFNILVGVVEVLGWCRLCGSCMLCMLF